MDNGGFTRDQAMDYSMSVKDDRIVSLKEEVEQWKNRFNELENKYRVLAGQCGDKVVTVFSELKVSLEHIDIYGEGRIKEEVNKHLAIELANKVADLNMLELGTTYAVRLVGTERDIPNIMYKEYGLDLAVHKMENQPEQVEEIEGDEKDE